MSEPLKTGATKWNGHKSDMLRYLREIAQDVYDACKFPQVAGDRLLTISANANKTMIALIEFESIAVTENDWLRAKVGRLEARIEELEKGAIKQT